MVILELAVQAVRGFSPSARVALKAGYVALRSPTEVPAPLAGLLTALCYPDVRVSDTSFLAQGARAGRAGFSFQGADGAVWRLVRDLGGAGALYGQDPQTQQFQVVSQTPAEISQLLRTQVGLPARAHLDQLFTFTVGQLPTRVPRRVAKKTDAAGRPQRVMASALDAFDVPEEQTDPRERLAAYEAELKTARRVADTQFRIDGLQAEIYTAEERLRKFDEVSGRLDALRAELAATSTPEAMGLPLDISDRIRRLPDERKRRDELLTRLDAERESAGVQDRLSVPSILRDQRFLGALVLGLALLVGADSLEGVYRYLALVSIVPLSFAALLLLRYVEELQHADREASKLDLFTGREKKIRDDFEQAEQLVQTALDKAGTPTQDDFFALMAKQDGIRPQVAELERQVAELAAAPENRDVLGTIARLRAEHDALTGELTRLSGGYSREVREIERDIARLKEQLAPRREAAAADSGPGESFDDPTPGMMLLGADLFNTDVSTLWGVLRERALQYLVALTDRRYDDVDVGSDGYAVVHAPGKAIAASELPGRDLDLLFLSLRLTLIEKYSAHVRVPMIFEDAFSSVIDQAKQPLFQRMLKHIGTLTQVLHVTGVGQNVAGADVVVSL